MVYGKVVCVAYLRCRALACSDHMKFEKSWLGEGALKVVDVFIHWWLVCGSVGIVAVKFGYAAIIVSR